MNCQALRLMRSEVVKTIHWHIHNANKVGDFYNLCDSDRLIVFRDQLEPLADIAFAGALAYKRGVAPDTLGGGA